MNNKMFTEQWYREQAQCCAYEGDWGGEAWYRSQANCLAAATKAAEEEGMTVGDYLFSEGWSIEDIQKLIGEVAFTAVWNGYSPVLPYASKVSYRAAVEAADEENGRCYEEPFSYYQAGSIIPIALARELAAQGRLRIVD